MADYHEHVFEAELCDYLEQHGWLYSRDDTGYGELVKQLFDAEGKRVDYFHTLLSLLYLEADRDPAS